AGAQTSGTLFPSGQGFYTAWTNGVSNVDETGSVSCTDYVSSSTSNQRESVAMDLSSIPDGSTITSVNALVWDVGSGSSGGTYRTFVRVGSDTDAAANLSTTST